MTDRHVNGSMGLTRGDVIARVAGLLAVVMIGALVVGQIGMRIAPGWGALNWVAAAAAVMLALIRLPHVQRIARIFAIAALGVAALVALAAPEALPAMTRALFQGTAFSAFLTTLGLIRAPVRASRVIGVAAARLFAYPARMRSAAMTFGAQFLSVLFNIGTIGMMSDIATDHAARARAEGKPGIDPAPVTLAALRGTILMTVWNPIGVGFAIVTSAIPGLDPVRFLALSFGAAMLVSAGSLLIGRTAATADPESTATVQGGRALAAILAAVAGLIAVTLALHRGLDISFLVAACLVLPLLAVLWPRIEPAARAPKGTSPLAALSEASAVMANEATIFLAAAVIGAGVSVALNALGIGALIESGALPALAIILGCLVLIPLAGALMIPHSIVMVMAAQLFGAGPVGAAHPFALALALCFAWALAISASPISAMSIITGRHLHMPPTRVTFAVNRAFTLYGLAASAALITLIYFLE